MPFEWDPNKNAANLEKHGILFEEAALIFDGPVLTRIDDRVAYGEIREISIGEIQGVVTVAVVHTRREDRKRIISARLASAKERMRYHAYLNQTS